MEFEQSRCRGATLDDSRANAKQAFNERKDRRRHLPIPLFAEYGWDILLLLFAEEGAGFEQNVTQLAERVQAPVTTAVRWINYLEQRDLIERKVSDLDRREVHISLTEHGRNSMLSYFGTKGT